MNGVDFFAAGFFAACILWASALILIGVTG
jgi:hypothetical protein